MKKVALVFFPIPGLGHLISTVEIAKRLLQHHPSFSITVLLMHLPVPGIGTYLHSVASSGVDIHFHNLPPPTTTAQEETDMKPEIFISLFVRAHKSLVKHAIQEIQNSTQTTHVAALILDFFCTTLIDVALQLGIPSYIYFTSGASLLALMLHLPTLHDEIKSEFSEHQGEIQVPGMLPLSPDVMPTPLESRKADGYAWFMYHAKRFREARGIIVNTFGELEPDLLEAITSGRRSPAIYPVGPVLGLPEQSRPESSSSLMGWLDQQPDGSVVFLCFGSLNALSSPQIGEMAIGVEKSGHRFLWSLRCCLDGVLPEGFLGRTKGLQGMVWPSWVPQTAVLAHPAIGGFVSHCGWNSILESLWFGMPLLALPLEAEQRLNAFQLVKDYGVALELRREASRGGDAVVSAAEIERGVRCLMGDSEEGLEVRRKVKEVREASRKAVEEGGSSFASLARFVDVLLASSSDVRS
ncbi:hypothetical protein ACLOJK_029706 [Asimina triloba]